MAFSLLLYRSCILFFLPFFIVELFGFLQFFLSAGVKICCSVVGSQAMKKLVSKCDLLFFIGQKDPSRREQVLCLEAAKLVFSTGPQLCLQLWIQYLSIVCSLLLGTKYAYELISYSRLDSSEQQNTSWRQKFYSFLKLLRDYLSWLPLILTSFLFKIGSIILYMKFFGWFSIFIILIVLLLNAVGNFIILTKCGSVAQNPGVSIWTEDLINSGNKYFHFLDTIFLGFRNIFVVSRPFSTIRKLFLP